MGAIWPLFMAEPMDFHALEAICIARIVSKAWKALANTNVIWLVAQVAKDDVNTFAMRLLMLEGVGAYSFYL